MLLQEAGQKPTGPVGTVSTTRAVYCCSDLRFLARRNSQTVVGQGAQAEVQAEVSARWPRWRLYRRAPRPPRSTVPRAGAVDDLRPGRRPAWCTRKVPPAARRKGRTGGAGPRSIHPYGRQDLPAGGGWGREISGRRGASPGWRPSRSTRSPSRAGRPPTCVSATRSAAERGRPAEPCRYRPREGAVRRACCYSGTAARRVRRPLRTAGAGRLEELPGEGPSRGARTRGIGHWGGRRAREARKRPTGSIGTHATTPGRPSRPCRGRSFRPYGRNDGQWVLPVSA